MLFGSRPISTRIFAILRLSAAVSRMRSSIVERSARLDSIRSSSDVKPSPAVSVQSMDFTSGGDFGNCPFPAGFAVVSAPGLKRGNTGSQAAFANGEQSIVPQNGEFPEFGGHLSDIAGRASNVSLSRVEQTSQLDLSKRPATPRTNIKKALWRTTGPQVSGRK